MKYNNRIKIDGDFSVASQWLGFAKNKANFLYDLSERQGINYVKTYTPTGDVTIKVSIIQKIPHIYIRAIGGYVSGVIRYNEKVLYNHDNNPDTNDIYGVKEFFPSPTSLKLGFKKDWKTTNKIYSESKNYYYSFGVSSTSQDTILYQRNNIYSKYNQQNFNIKSGNFTGLLQKYIQLTLGTNFKIELESNYQTTHGLIMNPLTKELWLIQIKSPFIEIMHEENSTPLYTINNDGGVYATRFSHSNGIIKTLKFPEITEENIDNGIIIQLLTKEQLYDFYKNRIPLYFDCGWSFDYINGLKSTNSSIQVNNSFIIKSIKVFDLEFSFVNSKPVLINKSISHDYTYNSNYTSSKIINTGLKIQNTFSDSYKIIKPDIEEEIYFYSFFEPENINKTTISLKYKKIENLDLTNYYTNTVLDGLNSNNKNKLKTFEYFEYKIHKDLEIFVEYIYSRILPKCLVTPDNFPNILTADTIFTSIVTKMLFNFNNDSLVIFPKNDRSSIVFYNNFNISTIYYQSLLSDENWRGEGYPTFIEIELGDIDKNLELNFLNDTNIFIDYNFILTNDISNNFSRNYKFVNQLNDLFFVEKTYNNFNFNAKNYYSNKTSVYKNKKIDKYINKCNLHQNRHENNYYNLTSPYIAYYYVNIFDYSLNYNTINCFLNFDIFKNKYVIELESPYNPKKLKNDNNKNTFLFTIFENNILNDTLYDNLILTESNLSNFEERKILSNLTEVDKNHYNLDDFYSLDKYNNITSLYTVISYDSHTYSESKYVNKISYNYSFYDYNIQSKSLSFIGKPFE